MEVLLIVAIAMCCVPQAELPSQETTKALAKDITAALDAPRPKLLPAFLIFPMVGEGNVVRPDGAKLSHMAMFSATYGPERRMSTNAPYTLNVLSESGCSAEGTVLNDALIELCRAACDFPSYAIPRLTRKGQEFLLEVDLYDDKDVFKRYEYSVAEQDYGLIPGQIAKAVLEHVGAELTARQLEQLTKRQAGTEEEGAGFASWPTQSTALLDAQYRRYLASYPDCLFGWEMYLACAHNARSAIEYLESQQPPVPCERLQVIAAVRLRNMGWHVHAIRRLLTVLPTHADDTYFWSTFVRCALVMEDAELSDRVLAEWRRSSNKYADHLLRGINYIDWAWDARGSGLAHQVTPEGWRLFHERLQQARQELEGAVAINPRGWAAHAQLIVVAMGLGLPRSYMEGHFRQALRVPANKFAYGAKLEYLKPRWHGTPEQLAAFGMECLDTGLWDHGIPPLFLEAIDDAYPSPQVRRSEKLWRDLNRYKEQVMLHGSKQQQSEALRYLAETSSRAGKHDEAGKLFAKLAADYGGGEDEDAEIADLVNFLHLQDHIEAYSDTSPQTAQLRIAISEGRLDDATRILDAMKPNSLKESGTVQHYRRVVHWARQLEADGEFTLEPRHLEHAFDAIISRSLKLFNYGEVRGEEYVWQCDPGDTDEFYLVSPVSFALGTIRGSLGWQPGVLLVEVAWRQRTNQAPAYLRYYPETSELVIVEDGLTRHQKETAIDHLEFEIKVGNEKDSITINGDTEWDLFTDPAEPGTFSIRAVAKQEPGTFTTFAVRELQISTR